MKNNNKSILIRDKSSNIGAVYRSTNIRDLKKSDVVRVNKEYHSKKVVENTEIANPLRFVLGFIALILLFITLFRLTGNIGNGEPLTFTGFLDYLSGLDFGQVNWNLANVSITDDWGILNPLRTVINFMLGGFNFVLTIISALINVVVFLFNIAKFIFVGA